MVAPTLSSLLFLLNSILILRKITLIKKLEFIDEKHRVLLLHCGMELVIKMQFWIKEKTLTLYSCILFLQTCFEHTSDPPQTDSL